MTEGDPLEQTPFDQAWSQIGMLLLICSVAVIALLTIGTAQMLDGPGLGISDGAAVGVAHYGLIVVSAGLGVMAVLARANMTWRDGREGIAWPRFRPLEDDEGPRMALLARGSLATLLLLPLFALGTCLARYVKTSHVACWQGAGPLDTGFLSSRVAAWSAEGPCGGPMLGMHHEAGAPQWFVWSDPLLVLLAALVVWGWLGLAMRLRRERRHPRMKNAAQ